MPSSNGISWTHSGRRIEIERAVAEWFSSGAITASSMSSSADERPPQRLQALGVDPVVVGEQHAQQGARLY